MLRAIEKGWTPDLVGARARVDQGRRQLRDATGRSSLRTVDAHDQRARRSPRAQRSTAAGEQLITSTLTAVRS